MTPERIADEIYRLADYDGGLIKSRVIERLRELEGQPAVNARDRQTVIALQTAIHHCKQSYMPPHQVQLLRDALENYRNANVGDAFWTNEP